MSDALIEAIESGDIDRVAKLLAAGADPNATRPRYYNPLQDAVCEYEPPENLGRVDAIVLLLRHGALVDGRERPEDGTPLGSSFFVGRPKPSTREQGRPA